MDGVTLIITWAEVGLKLGNFYSTLIFYLFTTRPKVRCETGRSIAKNIAMARTLHTSSMSILFFNNWDRN